MPAYFLLFHAERRLGFDPDDWWVLTVNAWLTTAFSVALLAAGAGFVESVDLSAAYLEWLGENLRRNGLAAEGPRHAARRLDGRRFLESRSAAVGGSITIPSMSRCSSSKRLMPLYTPSLKDLSNLPPMS